MVVPCAVTQAGTLAPTFWKQPVFFIPYQVKGSGKLLDPVAKVQLLTSRTGANDWRTLEEAKPNVQGFSFHAPEDGEYWFALRHLDRRGRPWPNAEVQPQMRIVVDTAKPTLRLEGSPDTTGEIVVRYEASDANLNAKSLVVEVRSPRSQWSPLPLDPADIVQPNRLVGRSRWRPPAGAESIELRASIADLAGQRAQTKANVPLLGSRQPLIGPTFGESFLGAGQVTQQANAGGPPAPNTISNPFASASQLPSQDWPANNRLPIITNAPQTVAQPPPPQRNPYTATSPAKANRTPAKLVGDGRTNSRRAAEPGDELQSLGGTPLGPGHTPSRAESTPWASPQSKTNTVESDWSPAQSPAPLPTRVVNSLTFDIEYDLQSVGPWGVSKIELWGTHDNGRTWRSFGVDPDNRSPFRVTVPQAGTFGFRILVDGANSAGSPPPQAGDEPELSVSVDLQPPTAELLAAELGQGNLADHLLVRWTAADTNLEPRPIALFYSSYPNGPWSTIASGLENTGSYTWRIERHVPGRFYLRLEARDIAGNLATFQTPTPIQLSRPQPSGRLRSVRPIVSN